MYIIDRFEGESAIIEQDDETFIAVPRDTVPAEAREGDVLEGDGIRFTIDIAETQRRRERIRKKLNRLFKKNRPE